MYNFGPMNAHLVGIAMKEMVRRVIGAIRTERFVFEAQPKRGYSGEMDDLVTTADRAAQAIYVKLMREMFPTFGIVAEEDELSLPCSDNRFGDIYFTVDPLDGTKAFARKQSHGVGTMISLVRNGEIIAVCIGDVMTREIYYYRPGSDCVHRISEFDHAERLAINEQRRLDDQHILLRDRPEALVSPTLRQLVAPLEQNGAFKGIEITGGSIGISMARLWKGEVGAAINNKTVYDTPWDSTPVMGISQKLGFVFLKPDERTGKLEVFTPVPAKVKVPGQEFLVIHSSQLESLLRR
jgi:fructose-1,6-bisphosphatase/inositol monophosphatase family enzyme